MRKKTMLFLLCALLVTGLFSGCENSGSSSQEEGKLTVYTSFYPMFDFVSRIGGDKVEVVNMVPAGTEPHDWEPSAADILRLEKARLFVFNGAGLEHWVEDEIGRAHV